MLAVCSNELACVLNPLDDASAVPCNVAGRLFFSNVPCRILVFSCVISFETPFVNLRRVLCRPHLAIWRGEANRGIYRGEWSVAS